MKVIFRGGDGRLRTTQASWKMLAAEFPPIGLRVGQDREEGGAPSIRVRSPDWRSQSFNFYEFDASLDALAERTEGPFAIVLAAEEEQLPGFARQVLTRCQRLMNRRNAESTGALFDRILARHRAMHDLAKPLVRADYSHALDTWHWTLRLKPEAGLPVQLAALFHDVERLESEADVRKEQHAADYQGFKDTHAGRGAAMADAVLARAGVGAEIRLQAAWLIARHERPPEAGADSADIALLNDADALSFFSLNSVGYLDYYGPEQTRRKVAYTLRRLRPETRRHLAAMRLPPRVSAAVAEAAITQERVA